MTVDDRRCRPSASPRYGSIAARRRDSNRLRLGKPWDGRHRGPKKSGYDVKKAPTRRRGGFSKKICTLSRAVIVSTLALEVGGTWLIKPSDRSLCRSTRRHKATHAKRYRRTVILFNHESRRWSSLRSSLGLNCHRLYSRLPCQVCKERLQSGQRNG